MQLLHDADTDPPQPADDDVSGPVATRLRRSGRGPVQGRLL
jgi:hypothetical protein